MSLHADNVTHILVVLQEDVEVEVFPEDGVGGDAAQEHLVHCDSLLEDGQVLPDREGSGVSEENRRAVGQRTEGGGDSRLQLLLHLSELLLGHGTFPLPQLLQFLSGCIKVWPRRRRRDLHSNPKATMTRAPWQ